jgi:hypothetical protein
MAKYMPQDLFDAFAIGMALEKVFTGKKYQDLAMFGQFQVYKSSYPEDELFMEQVLDAAIAILDGWKDMDRSDLITLLTSLFELRKQLDENLDKKKTLSKIFGGTIFASGHPDPKSRVAQAIQNINIMAAVL